MHGSATPSPPPARTPSPRRRGSAAALVVAFLALLASLAALWLLWQGRTDAMNRADEVARLQASVDSLNARVQELIDPFGPTAGDPALDSLTVPPNDTVP